jgi:UDP-glucuronate 4-epimerase
MSKVFVTGSAGFIGSALTIRLLERGDSVIGLDNHNQYYDPKLKEARLERHISHPNYIHNRMDLDNHEGVMNLFNEHKFDKVVNLAAQAGVLFSIESPMSYIESNLVGFANILEACRHNHIKHLVYASSSSVYGSNTIMPFSTHSNADHPLSLYAATKKANELMAHSYSHLYEIPTTGLRFFSVYGPWGRPDMALYKFTRKIIAGEEIQVNNNGNHSRDFTYIDDIVEGLIRVLDKPPVANSKWDSDNPDPATSSAPWCLYNIGNNKPIKLLEYIEAIEDALGMKANKVFASLQPGDVPDTYADVSDLVEEFDYKPEMLVKTGVKNFVNWYKDFHNV